MGIIIKGNFPREIVHTRGIAASEVYMRYQRETNAMYRRLLDRIVDNKVRWSTESRGQKKFSIRHYILRG